MTDFRKPPPRIVPLLSLAVVSIILSVTLGAYWFRQGMDQLGDQSRQQATQLITLQRLMTEAGLEQAAQTQEWKDLLLRSHQPELVAAHKNGFYIHADAVQRKLQSAADLARVLNIDNQKILQLNQSHDLLLREYGDALQFLDPQQALSFRRVDERVRGKDRQLRADLWLANEMLSHKISNKINEMGKVVADSDAAHYFNLLRGLTLALPLVALLAFAVAWSALRRMTKSDAQARAIYESIADAVLVIDPQGRLVSINDTAQKLMNLSVADVVGKKVSDVFQIFDAQTRQRRPSPAELVLLDGKAIPMANGMILRRADHSELAIEDSAAPIFDRNSKLSGVVMVFHDVSKRYALMQDLQQQKALFQQTFDMAAVGMAHLGLNGKWTRVNRKLCEITGYTEAELLELSFKGITHPDDLERDLSHLQNLLTGEVKAYHAEKRYIRQDGRVVWIALTVSIIWKEDGSPDYGISIIEDIQTRKEAEQAAVFANEQYQVLFELIPEGVVLLDEQFKVVAHNQEALRQLEYSSEELLTMHLSDFKVSGSEDENEQRARDIQLNGRCDCESVYRTRNGRLMDVDVSVQRVSLPDGKQVYQTLFRDITQQNLAAAQIEHLAYHDQLTGLANRRLLKDRLEQAINSLARRHSMLGILYIDLDHFKDVNDSLGHQVGDQLLQEVARRLHDCVRVGDTLARIGGDEFVIMLNDLASVDDAAMVAEKVVRSVSQTITLGHEELHVTPSVGISMSPQDGHDTDELLKHADAALYQAKQSGRSTYRFYTSELHQESLERLKIERLLRKAVERNEFELYYQPQIDLQRGGIVGCEALIRWNQPALGFVQPVKFIPVAEHSKLIVEIGEWVMREACRQAKVWQDRGLNLKVSFNVSARQFMQPAELLQTLRRALQDSGVNPALMQMELTESLLLDANTMNSALQEIRGMGMQLALDDFGTGYSSLSYLRRFPIGVLKIDQSFVGAADKDETEAEMVKTIIGMGHNLKMGLVAEGIETQAQSDLLTEQGCDIGQGYHYSRPVPVAEFEKLLLQS